MKNIHINDSYKIWRPAKMRMLIEENCMTRYRTTNVKAILNRSYGFMYIEWWLHNIVYYITKPFYFSKTACALNLRAKNVDLEEYVNNVTTE